MRFLQAQFLLTFILRFHWIFWKFSETASESNFWKVFQTPIWANFSLKFFLDTRAGGSV